MFKLSFEFDGKEVNLAITWTDKDKKVILPTSLWPQDDDHLEYVARVVFSEYNLKRKAEEARKRVKEDQLKRALVKAGGLVHRVRVRSRTSGREYDIKILGRKITCSCPDFTFRRRGEGDHCKHISAWLKTRTGKETFEKVHRSKVREKISLEQIERMFEHRYELADILREHQCRKNKSNSSSTTSGT